MGDTRLSKLPPLGTGGFVLPGRVKQRMHERAAVSFCGPVQSTGFPEQTMSHLPIEQPAIEGRNNTGLIVAQKRSGIWLIS